MKTYQHTQSGRRIIKDMLVMAAVMAVLGCCLVPQFLILLPFLLLCGWLFSDLRIEIAGDELRWHFGPGLISKRVSLAEISSQTIVRTTFWEGWDIHWSRFGWLYNVSGHEAVAITLRNGKKFALGTDEPEPCARRFRKTPGISSHLKGFEGFLDVKFMKENRLIPA